MECKLHTKIKHQILGYYYGALKNVLKSMYSYYYVDLFAGDGICTCEIPEHINSFLPSDFRKEWRPPYFSLMDHAREIKKYKNIFSLKCIFNDLSWDNYQQLKNKLTDYQDCILAIENLDANKYYSTAINLIKNPNKPSLFYLDPTNHEHLKFETIRQISKFMDIKSGRKPELIINLMVYSMLKALQRGTKEDLDGISESLGSNSWIEKKDEYLAAHQTHELFKETFIEKLKDLGYNCSWYYIRSTTAKSTQYYLIFATYNKKIFEIQKRIQSNIEKLQQEEWVKRTTEVSWLINNIADGQKKLTDNFN